jgi:hypothetical protein
MNAEDNHTTDRRASYTVAKDPGLTREEWLARCETLYRLGLTSPNRLRLLAKWLEFVMRLEGGQMNDVARFLVEERDRTGGFVEGGMLASDDDGYALFRLGAVLSHHCQACAEDPGAWHTRSAFCEHQGPGLGRPA